jgi:hypothetical protein
VVAEGQGAKTSKLADRLEALHVPGMSITGIRAKKIEWARGFGVTKVDGPPVTHLAPIQSFDNLVWLKDRFRFVPLISLEPPVTMTGWA